MQKFTNTNYISAMVKSESSLDMVGNMNSFLDLEKKALKILLLISYMWYNLAFIQTPQYNKIALY